MFDARSFIANQGVLLVRNTVKFQGQKTFSKFIDTYFRTHSFLQLLAFYGLRFASKSFVLKAHEHLLFFDQWIAIAPVDGGVLRKK